MFSKSAREPEILLPSNPACRLVTPSASAASSCDSWASSQSFGGGPGGDLQRPLSPPEIVCSRARESRLHNSR